MLTRVSLLVRIVPAWLVRSIAWWCLGLGLSLITTILWASPGQSASTLEFIYPRIAQLSIPLANLEAFVRDGQISPQFKTYIQLTNAQPEDLQATRDVLQQRYQISPTTVSQFTKTHLGELLLEQLGQVFRTTSNQDGGPILREALIRATSSPEGLTVLNFLHQYPEATVQIDLRSSLRAIKQLFDLFREKDLILARIKQVALAAPNLPLPSPDSDLQQLGPYHWRLETRQFHNPERRVGETNFPADLYLPQGGVTPLPLVVISHGFASNRTTFAYLARHLASYGLAVVVPDHPQTNTSALKEFFAGLDEFPGPQDWIERPRDITFLLNQLQEQPPAVPLNLNQVAVLGQSLGGYTALALGGAQVNLASLIRACPKPNGRPLTFDLALLYECDALKLPKPVYNLRDERVKAVLAINPISGQIFGPEGFRHLQVPVAILAGSDDLFSPPVPEQIYPFLWLRNPHKYLVLVDKGTHFSFLAGTQGSVVKIPPDLLGPDPRKATPTLKAISLAFMQVHLRQQPAYDAYLSQTYLQSISQAPFSFSIVTHLNRDQLYQPVSG